MQLQFTTIAFILCLFILFHIVPGKARGYVLLAGSILFIFNVGGPKSLIVLLAITLITYISGLLLAKRKSSTGYIINIAALAIVLFGWKYAPGVAIPIGLSFYTFQAISYIADIHRGKVRPIRISGNLLFT